MSYSLAESYQHFRRLCDLNLQSEDDITDSSKTLVNFYQTVRRVQHPMKQNSSIATTRMSNLTKENLSTPY